mmetsp:Transcript_67184/g.190541  ORF Transcript_67184/g.190541 Transcript_67184/m.190541 type:complete len:273 (-) Transcript_67184:226-1044(-)
MIRKLMPLQGAGQAPSGRALSAHDVLEAQLRPVVGARGLRRAGGHAAVLELPEEVDADGVLVVEDAQRGARGAVLALQAERAGADLADLLRDGGLALLVVDGGEPLLEVLRVVGRGLHGGHARGELRGLCIEKQRQELRVQVEREHGVEDRRRGLVEDHVRLYVPRLGGLDLLFLDLELAILGGQLEGLVLWVLDAGGGQRQDRADGGLVLQQAEKLAVDDLDLVHLSREEEDPHGVADLACGLRGDGVGHPEECPRVVDFDVFQPSSQPAE